MRWDYGARKVKDILEPRQEPSHYTNSLPSHFLPTQKVKNEHWINTRFYYLYLWVKIFATMSVCQTSKKMT